MGVAALLTAMALDGGNLMALLQVSAFVIVGGGTIAATLVQTPIKGFVRALKMIVCRSTPPKVDRAALLRLNTDWLRIPLHQFVLALDPVADQQTDPFIRL